MKLGAQRSQRPRLMGSLLLSSHVTMPKWAAAELSLGRQERTFDISAVCLSQEARCLTYDMRFDPAHALNCGCCRSYARLARSGISTLPNNLRCAWACVTRALSTPQVDARLAPLVLLPVMRDPYGV